MIKLILIFVITLSAFAEEENEPSPRVANWLTTYCPTCRYVSDDVFEITSGTNRLQMSIIRADNQRISMKMLSRTDSRGQSYPDLTFPTVEERERYTATMRSLCQTTFRGFDYYSSGIDFTEGSHWSDSRIPTRGRITLACYREQTWGERISSMMPWGDDMSINDDDRNTSPPSRQRQAPANGATNRNARSE